MADRTRSSLCCIVSHANFTMRPSPQLCSASPFDSRAARLVGMVCSRGRSTAALYRARLRLSEKMRVRASLDARRLRRCRTQWSF
jgi:hypothetical protein